MKNCNYIYNLNQYCKTNGLNDRLTFYDQDKTPLNEVLKGICPYSKIALVFDKYSYDEYNSYSSKLVEFGFNVVTIIEEDFYLSVENTAKLYSLSEEVRGIVCFTPKAFDLVSYFASINNIKVVFYIDSLDIIDSLKNRAIVKNGAMYDYVKLDLCRHIVFDNQKISIKREDQAQLYIHILSRLISLIDYRIGGLAETNSLDSAVYNPLRDAVLKTYLIYTKSYEEQPFHLLENFYMAEILNILSNGQLADYSAPSLTAFLYGDYKLSSSINLLERLLGLYAIAFKIQGQNTLAIRNYFCDLVSIKTLSNMTAIETYPLIKKKASIYKDKEDSFVKLMQTLKNEIDLLSRSIKTIKQTYLALGGRENFDSNRINECMCYSGCIFDCFNGVSLVKEMGVLD